MNTTKVDDRTPEQRATYKWGVVARDKFMSGWGGARGGASYCAWACPSLDAAEQFERWVANRKEMRFVRVVNLNAYRAPRGTAHFHIYVAEPGHVGYPRTSKWADPDNTAKLDAILAEVDE